MHYYISRKATGNQEQFSKKLNISISTLNLYLREMKILMFPIAYDKMNSNYYYTKENKRVADLLLNLEELNLLDKEQMKQCRCNNKTTDDVGLYHLCLDEKTGVRHKSDVPC